MNIKEQIKAEIERRRRDVEQQRHARGWGKSYYVMMSELLDIIANLPQEQPSEDLEKEVKRFLESEESTTYENAGSYKVAVKDPLKIARHFYKLGLNSRKEE